MIKLQYLDECSNASRHGVCVGCGKDSKEDEEMVRVTFRTKTGHSTSICLCNECRIKLFDAL